MSATIQEAIELLERKDNEVPMLTMEWFAERIKQAAKNDEHFSIVLIGHRGAGKTAFALHLGKEVYGTYEESLKHLFFPEQIGDLAKYVIRSLKHGYVIPYIIIDDAGNRFQKYNTPDEFVKKFFKLVNLMRGAVGCVAYTDVAMIHKYLRDTSEYRIKVSRIPNTEPKMSQARIYLVDFNIKLEDYVKAIGGIQFETYYPIYPEYKKTRQSITLREWEEFLEMIEGGYEELANSSHGEISNVVEFAKLVRSCGISARTENIRKLWAELKVRMGHV